MEAVSGGGGGKGSPCSADPPLLSPCAAVTAAEFVSVEQKQAVTESAESGGGGESSVIETSGLDEAVLRIKEEVAEEVFVNAVTFGDSTPPSSASRMASPKPMKGLHETCPSPFLRKAFEIVEDPETDPIVSWSPTRNSFIVWDSYKFSENLLPKYFKHKNFSSFIRQLNTYGFRKVDSDRWEFANEGFQGGKRHLLKNIKRRSRSDGKRPRQSRDTSVILSPLGLETDIESLKKEQSLLRSEILRLKQQQEESYQQMVTVQDRVFGVESKQQHILNFLVKVAKDRRFVQRVMNKRKRKELGGGEILKNPKLLRSQATKETLPDDTERGPICEKLAELKTDMPLENLSLDLSPGDDEFYTCVGDHGEENMMCGLNMGMSPMYGAMSDELVEGGLVAGNENTGDITLTDSKIYMELEDLLGKTRTLGG